MTCPDAKTWGLLSMGLLDENRAELLRQHSLECDRCSAVCQEASRQHADLLGTFQAFDCHDDRRRDQLMAMLPASAPFSSRESDVVPRTTSLGGIAANLRRHTTGWAAVAVLPAAIMLLVFWLTTVEKSAFADVLEKMRQAKTMTCDVVTTTTVLEGQLPEQLTQPRRGTISMYFDGDTRAVLHEDEQGPTMTVTAVVGGAKDGEIEDVSFGSPNGGSERKHRTLVIGDTTYVWKGDKVRVVNTIAGVGQRPATADWLSRFLEVRESPDRKLGTMKINGRRAVGFEIAGWKLGYGMRPTKANAAPTASDLRLRVWVDVEQNLPIRLEFEQPMVTPDLTATIHSRWENIKWNVELDPDDFRPPGDDEIAKDKTIQAPIADEASFVDGMRAWLEWKDKAIAGLVMMKKEAQERGEKLPAMISNSSKRAALDAGYPERLDISWLQSTSIARAGMASWPELLEGQPIAADMDEGERTRLRSEREKQFNIAATEAMNQASLKAITINAFYHKLANEQRDPEYFGATVKPGDSEAILLKWKLDDSRYRVIYGDLRAQTVDSAE